MRFTSLNKLLIFVLLAGCSAFGQSINLDTQVKGSRLPMWAVDSGSANAYAIATIGALGPSLRTGSRFAFIATHANTTASTLAVDGGSTIAIKKNVSAALVSGDIALNQVIEVTYDGTNFQLVGPGALTFSAIGGTLGCSQLPTFTGDVTNSSCAMTIATVTVPKGGTGQTSLTAHNLLLGEGSSLVGFLSLGAHQIAVGQSSADPVAKTIPDCQDSSGNHLNYTQSTDTVSCGTSSSGGGGGTSPLVLLETHTASASSELDFTSCIGTYAKYLILIDGLTLSAVAIPGIQLSTNGGSSYDSTSGHYKWSGGYAQTSGNGSIASGADTQWKLRDVNTTLPSGGSFNGTFVLHVSSSLHSIMQGEITLEDVSANFVTIHLAGMYTVNSPNAFRVIPTSGTLSAGTVSCYGYQ